MSSVKVSIIIPTLDGNVEKLLLALQKQTYKNTEVIKVVGVKPNGRARNHGVQKAGGDVFLFIDDDAIPGPDDLIQKLVEPLITGREFHITGGSKLLSPDATALQKRIAYEVPRIEHKVVPRDLETNPGVDSYVFSEITTTCCAMRKRDFFELGGFSEHLIRGVDTEFFFRARKREFRFLLVANTWVYHNPPGNLMVLLKKYFQMGIGHAQEASLNPERNIGIQLKGFFSILCYMLFRFLIVIPNIFIPYSFAYRKIELSFKPIKALVSYVNSLGYVYGSFLKKM